MFTLKKIDTELLNQQAFRLILLEQIRNQSSSFYMSYPHVDKVIMSQYLLKSMEYNLKNEVKQYWLFEDSFQFIVGESFVSPFDYEHFGFNIIWLNIVLGPSTVESQSAYKRLFNHMINNINYDKPALFIARLNIVFIGAIQSLETLKFRFYETNAYTVRSTEDDVVSTKPIQYSLATDSNIQIISKMAKDHNFQGSHLHLNDNIPKSKVDLMYQKWIENVHNQLNGYILLMDYKETPAGYFTFSVDDELNQALGYGLAKTGIIGLSKTFSGKGLGSDLILGGIKVAKDQGATFIDSSYSLNNQASSRLHQNMGFKTIGHSMTLHRWMN